MEASEDMLQTHAQLAECQQIGDTSLSLPIQGDEFDKMKTMLVQLETSNEEQSEQIKLLTKRIRHALETYTTLVPNI